jgi:biofilm protein TabA
MLIDQIRQANRYTCLSPDIAKALNYLEETRFAEAALGRVALAGDRLFALVQDYETQPREQGVWEAHRRYVDVQFVVSGAELIGYAPVERLTVTEPYAAAKDLARFAGAGDFLTVEAGTFVILYPHDAHMPGIACREPARVRKVVVKVAI